MLITELKRTSVAVAEWEPEVLELASEAETILGYKALREAQDVELIDKPLARLLTQLGIDPFVEDDVKKYKKEKQKEVARLKFEEWLNDSGASSSFWAPTWQDTKIELYSQPIPEYVLNKAIQIKKAMPEVQIRVSYLEENPDPFLVVIREKVRSYKDSKGVEQTYNAVDETYFVEVWEEPKFEGRVR